MVKPFIVHIFHVSVFVFLLCINMHLNIWIIIIQNSICNCQNLCEFPIDKVGNRVYIIQEIPI